MIDDKNINASLSLEYFLGSLKNLGKTLGAVTTASFGVLPNAS
ncbi:MAG: Uncharacterised protein [Gammaproteobacteria bacterium]|nr:MAG: Uncharacterised protein [Gammaproteobacteria bacterium]